MSNEERELLEYLRADILATQIFLLATIRVLSKNTPLYEKEIRSDVQAALARLRWTENGVPGIDVSLDQLLNRLEEVLG